MDNPGTYDLALINLTAALSAQAQTAIVNLDGMTAVSLEFEFLYGSGGTSASAVVQTSLDGGNTWRDIARKDFATSATVYYCCLEGLLSKGMTQYQALATDGVNDAYLGDRLRAVITSVGVYATTTLNVRASVR